MNMLIVSLILVSTPQVEQNNSSPYFTIRVVDDQTGRGVPMVELKTVNSIRYYTDSNGIVAFHEPGLMDTEVFFQISSHGYEYPADGFGYAGKRLHVQAGKETELRIHRRNIAQRLYRITGQGIYRDSILANIPVPIHEPSINGLVIGQDSIQNIIYNGKLYWFWGDTSRPAYPLGNFHMSGATSKLPIEGGLHPDKGVNLEYFVDEKGFSRAMAFRPEPGPVWMSGFAVLPDEHGRETMVAAYARVNQSMKAQERGFMRFNDEKEVFEKIIDFPLNTQAYPTDHPFMHAEDGIDYLWFPSPFPLYRVEANLKSYLDVKQCQAWTPLVKGTTLDDPKVDRDFSGTIRYGWKKDTPALDQQEQSKLIKAGKMKPGEAWIQLQDAQSGEPVLAHNGSVYWNEFRQRWITIRSQILGSSMLGETWYAEADTPLGPWVYARKIVTHDKYTFYNPKQHPFFDQENGRLIYFEGTYANTFSGNDFKTPRYDYNQIMYSLDLSDDRLTLPVPVYRVTDANGFESYSTKRNLVNSASTGPLSIEFFALDRPHPEAVAVRIVPEGANGMKLQVTPLGQTGDLRSIVDFYALPADTKQPPATTTPLYEFISDQDLPRLYSTDPEFQKEGYQKKSKPVCHIWKNPYDQSIHWKQF